MIHVAYEMNRKMPLRYHDPSEYQYKRMLQVFFLSLATSNMYTISQIEKLRIC